MSNALKVKSVPTKRAPDVWESARFTSIFLASGFFYISSIVHARPHAGNANRSAALLLASLVANGSSIYLDFIVQPLVKRDLEQHGDFAQHGGDGLVIALDDGCHDWHQPIVVL